jgi:hypothetical protein
MKVLTAVSLALLIATSVAHAANAAPNLAGAWRLVETRQHMTDGSTRPDPDLGAHPAGYMIYDPSGRMCTLFNDTDPPGWAGAKPTDTELRRMFNHSVVYCARYEVDSARGVITFHLDLGLNPGTANVTRERRFELKGDSLTLYPTPLPAGVSAWSIHLRRAKAIGSEPPHGGR